MFLLLFPQSIGDQPPIYVEILGSFLGFALALVADQTRKSYSNEHKGKQLLERFIEELSFNYKLLNIFIGELKIPQFSLMDWTPLSSEIWEMAKATGGLSHISSGPRIKLATIYTRINFLNTNLTRWHETRISNPVSPPGSPLEQEYRKMCMAVGEVVFQNIKEFLENFSSVDISKLDIMIQE